MKNNPLNYNLEKCSCGYDRSSPHIRHNSEYSSFGMILYWIGISAVPARVNFQCDQCKEIIESTDDPSVIKKYVGR
ncbi:MAG: hypothetical protein WC061_00450 [Melioribacteraceae bacterium]